MNEFQFQPRLWRAPDPTATVVELDRAHLWHPFTQMRDWCESDPLCLVEGNGAWLRDAGGRWYLDGNSSIWTNLHGHRHPRLDAALARQLEAFAHTSLLGFTHPAAARLAAELCALWPEQTLTRVFFSDNGSTAVEVAVRMALEFWELSEAGGRRRLVAFEGAYHGDTMGAASLGGLSAFRCRFEGWQLPVHRVGGLEELEQLPAEEIAGVVIEPLLQGANQMHVWPRGLLAALRAWCERTGAFLIADEVLTGFGRTGTLFACEQEGVVPDFLCLAKGLTGGYSPLAATLVRERVYEAFLGGPERTFYYGHSYCGHALGCALALENLAVFREESVLERVQGLASQFGRLLEKHLRPLSVVHEIRRVGLVAGIELRRPGGERFPKGERMGARVCLEARRYGLLTRPILDTVVLLPPYCVSAAELERIVLAVASAAQACCYKVN